MKKLIIIALLLTGCSNSYREVVFPVLPDELKDCKFFSITNTSGENLQVVRCPNSSVSTSYIRGKTKTDVITME